MSMRPSMGSPSMLFRMDENFMRFNFEAFEELRDSAEFIFDVRNEAQSKSLRFFWLICFVLFFQNMEQTLPSVRRPASWLDFLLDAPALCIDKLLWRFECWQHLQKHCKEPLAPSIGTVPSLGIQIFKWVLCLTLHSLSNFDRMSHSNKMILLHTIYFDLRYLGSS